MTKSEAQTRSDLTGKQLERSGWHVTALTQVVSEFDILTSLPRVFPNRADLTKDTQFSDFQFSDYVLLGKDSKPLVLVEAMDERIIKKATLLWHEDKKRIDPQKRPLALEWMRGKHLIPTDFGKHTKLNSVEPEPEFLLMTK